MGAEGTGGVEGEAWEELISMVGEFAVIVYGSEGLFRSRGGLGSR